MTSTGLLKAAVVDLSPTTEASSSGEVWLERPGALSQALPSQPQEPTAAECAGQRVCACSTLRGAGCGMVGTVSGEQACCATGLGSGVAVTGAAHATCDHKF